MKNLTTPQAILCGFVLIALAIGSIPYSSNIVTPAHAAGGVQKVAICTLSGETCVDILSAIGIYGNRYHVLGVGEGE